jgi:hypothetical protein
VKKEQRSKITHRVAIRFVANLVLKEDNMYVVMVLLWLGWYRMIESKCVRFLPLKHRLQKKIFNSLFGAA